MKPIDVTSDSHAEYNEDSHEKDPKFKVGDCVKISKYKNIFAKGYAQYWSKVVFIINKIKNTAPWTHGISDLNGEPITGSFCEKELQKTDQQGFRIEKVIKKKLINCTLNGKDTIIHLIIGLIRKTLDKNKSILSEAV